MELQKQVINSIADLTATLPKEGLQEVLERLLAKLEAAKLEELSPNAIHSLLKLLPPSLVISPHKICNLSVTDLETECDVSFIIPKGFSARKIIELIEKSNPRPFGCGVIKPTSIFLQNNPDIDRTVDRDTRFDTKLRFKSALLDRTEQGMYLESFQLKFTPTWVVILAAALYRDRMGFPANNIGTPDDFGDLLKGCNARTDTGSVKTFQSGVKERLIDDMGHMDAQRQDNIIAAGTFIS